MTDAPGFYLDDCIYSRQLVARLRQAGFPVVVPADAGLTGRNDPEHFAYAKTHGLVLITSNPSDFQVLARQHPAHPGVLAVYLDNDHHRDMRPADIVAAIRRLLETSPESLTGQFISLNAWRA